MSHSDPFGFMDDSDSAAEPEVNNRSRACLSLITDHRSGWWVWLAGTPDVLFGNERFWHGADTWGAFRSRKLFATPEEALADVVEYVTRWKEIPG